MAQWIEACGKDDIDEEDVKRFDHGGKTLPSTARPMTSSTPPMASARMRRSIWPMAW